MNAADPSAGPLKAPPKARIALRVGVVGHRPDRLPEDGDGQNVIRERLALVLEAVREAAEAFRGEPDSALYDGGPAILRAISPLAEGADRDFAQAAIDHGFSLCCPMPFLREEYERDFSGDLAQEAQSLDRFRGLLAAAETGPGLVTYELDGSRDDEPGAYGAAGRLVLNQSDLLVVVWDGGKARGGGGTVETLREAIGYHVPVVWIDARAPYGWALLRDQTQLDCLAGDEPCDGPPTVDPDDRARLAAAVRQVVLEELRLPQPEPGQEAAHGSRAHAEVYFRERRPRVNLFFQWKMFRDLVGGGRLRLPPLRQASFVEQVRRAWPVDASDAAAGPPPVMAAVNAALRAHYAWADKQADLYADAHRSTSVITSLFASLAVFLALLPMAMRWTDAQKLEGLWCGVAELLTLSTIVLLLTLSRNRRWHERWLEYRVLAELVRQLRLLAPLGGGRPLPRAPAHLTTYGDPAQSWMYWQIRAIARMVGIPTARVTPAYVDDCVEDLFDITDGPENGQLRFHISSHHRSERIHETLHRTTIILFWGTCLAVMTHLTIAAYAPEFDRTVFAGSERWLLLFSAVAPSMGAALANINNQGEFARLAKRSKAMAEGFAGFSVELALIRERRRASAQSATIAEVTSVARRMTEMMVDENVDWRVVVVDLAHAGG